MRLDSVLADEDIAGARFYQRRDTTYLGEPTDDEYIESYLSSLPTTEQVERVLAQLVAKRDALPEETTAARAQVQEHIDQFTWRRRLCEQRDTIAATRPDGCWCLGVGGKERRYTQGGQSVLGVVCEVCPEGKRAAEHKARVHREETAQRARAHAERLFGAAKVPLRFQECTLDSYPVSPSTSAAVAAIRHWQDGPSDESTDEEQANWRAHRKRSLLLHGPFGTGKTGLAVAILRSEIELEGGGLFFTVPSLLDLIRRTYSSSSQMDEYQVVEAVKNAPFLVLDDLGAERVTDWVAEKLFTVINHRHDEDLPTVFTSNLDVAQLGAHIGERTTWRIVEMCQVIRLDGPNLRDTR